ncbi:uncharacterized protein LOC110635178 isoform X3 [Hevea brasiliensis]|uniref:uncharacterized protein LOC110635178 isoform X3 n=1 Tax=Hevea brasiliensis TaxID=3981 RepID=UPI0025E9D36E|nr:uncharacterized protein LOC110635178 isoform X3 [Hevea brasiliensis]
MAAMAVDFCPFPVGLARFSLRFVFALLFSLSVAGSALCFPSRKDLFFESPISTLPELSNATMDSKRSSKYLEKITEATQLRYTFKMLDADFFNDTKVMETAEGALEFNLPIIKSNRRLVASENGGLHGPSCLVFNPEWTQKHVVDASKRFQHPALSGILRPKSDEDIAFMSILELGELIRTKQITSHELVQIFLERLKRYDPVLEAVITFTDELAYKQAREVDELIAKGVYLGILPIYYHHNLRTSVIFTVKMIFFEGFGNFEILLLTGPLHGIPYGLKDIIAVPGYKTTWGSRSFKDQVLNIEAWVYKRFQTYVKVFLLQSECTLITFFLFYANYRLRSAGAVLVAKLVSGSLAYDDIWFGGRTRNPWNIEEFSTGSSAGPAAGTSAGMVPFAIGSETAGSITFPASRCGVTALRPTFGAVGRTGVMSISESMDKLGAFCRSAADCSVILDVVRGKDPDDLSSRDIAFDDPFSIDITQLTVGYMDDAEMEVVHVLKAKGVNMVPFKLNYTVDSV